MNQTSIALQRIAPSQTTAMTDRATQLREQGLDIISLSVGEPDFATPPHVIAAAKAAMDEGQTKYTPVGGTSRMKQAAALHFTRDLGIEAPVDQVTVSAGGKQAIFHAMLATVSEGEEVIVPAPWWVSYPEIVRFAGGSVVPLRTFAKDNFRFTAADLETQIGPRTQWLLLNSPGNPTGAYYPAEMLVSLGELLRRHPRVMVLSDDIYAPLNYTGEPHATLANLCPDLADRILTVSGVSKSHAMTGFRIGVAAGPQWLIRAMEKLQSHSSGNPSSVSQAAAVAAFEGPQDFLADWRERFRARRDMVTAAINAISGLFTPVPDGAFYCMVDASPLMDRFGDDNALALHLLEHGVAVVPASGFGGKDGFRISFAAAEEVLEEGDAADRRGAFLMDIAILYEDAEALVIDKPGGLPLDRPRAGGESLADHLPSLRLGFQQLPVPVHRLDQDTSGCLLLARHGKALRRFGRAFEERRVAKRYLGVTQDCLECEEGTIALSLSKVSTARDGWRMIPARQGKPAVTHWRKLACHNGLALIEFRPETGRTHQIRVHAASGLAAPLLGDPVYGQAGGTRRTMLHAASLTVPRDGKPDIDAVSPLPADFIALGFDDG